MKKSKIYAKNISSLVKVFSNGNCFSPRECNYLTVLKGDSVSFQVVYYSDTNTRAKIRCESEIEKTTIRSIENVYSNYPSKKEEIFEDGNYLRTNKGFYPDVLRELDGGELNLKKKEFRTVRIDVEIPKDFVAGEYFVKVLLEVDGEIVCETVQAIAVLNGQLNDAQLIHTEWIYLDCIADYYKIKVFSKQHWDYIEKFIKVAASRGINMILTPLFTPPLDTYVGGDRTTVQLIDVYFDGQNWSFGFDKFNKFIEIAKKCGIQYFEMSHLFSQWDIKYPPKIMAEINGKLEKVFGWHTPISDGKYANFLRSFLPALIQRLEKLDIAQYTYFHVSDEPNVEDDEKNYQRYCTASQIVSPYIKEFRQIDAMSNVNFCKDGTVKTPVVSVRNIKKFLDNGITDLWAYYCFSPMKEYTNRFMAMTLARTRALGVQLYKFKIKGFLHWGYNFYNTKLSRKRINPYKITDAGKNYPSGDAFLVYPGKNGEPEESIRLMALYEAQRDLRALQSLEEKTSYEYVMSIVEKDIPQPIDFNNFPDSDYYYIHLRNTINKEIERYS